MVREERRGPGVRCLVVRGQGAPRCAALRPGLPTPSFPPQGCQGEGDALGFLSLTKPVLHCPTSPFSHPFPVAHAWAVAADPGPAGWRSFPFKERLKRPCGASANPRKKRGQSLWPHLELAAQHGGCQPASCQAACQGRPLLSLLFTGQGDRDHVPACSPRLRGSRGQVGRCSRHWQAGEGCWDGNPCWRSGVLGMVGAGSGHPIGVCSAVMQAAESQAG